ncbi:MAG: class I SAM-dependent methyltransferase [Planctomycetota bacterium]|nr:class I SAM-dependent methyltransferase [Planctomycetota bacterium]
MSRRSKTKKRKRTMAEKADKFKCYQLSVQSPDHEVEFFEQAFREVNGTSPLTMREDFCGTFAVCCSWVKSHPRRKAVGVDLCEETLQWGRDHNLKKLDPATGSRIRLINQDVRKKNRPLVDVLAAQNFSFWIFKTRKEIVEYFRIARANMKEGGVMILDMMGGGECYTEGHIDKRTIKKGKNGFHYYWEQARFNPVTSDASFYISFRFKDGSRLKHAFEYHWRFWTIPEVREMLEEAGFKRSHVYWEQEDENGEDTGVWAIGEEAISNPSWVCYIVGQK